jgi:23S rRNA (cytidine1920-2'-O)/16S rRNA (cytidine1409-2'-O)-methyltransferase
MPAKERLDKLLVEKGICESRQRAQALIMTGGVLVDDTPVDKAGTRVPVTAEIRLKKAQMPYVSRGGLKLEAALDLFPIDLEGKIAIDLGASTGGFTDCLLQRGCTKVVAIDVGYGLLHPKLRRDERVICLERTNARYVKRDDLGLPPETAIHLVTGDLSFISLHLILPTVAELLSPDGEAILLVKPQFEVGKEQLPKGGVVRDHKLRVACADRVSEAAATLGLIEQQRRDSPVHGPKGNIEILLHLKKHNLDDPDHA